MIKRLTPIGNSLGLIIDRPILDLLGIDRDTELEITTDGEMLIIQPLGEDASAGRAEITGRKRKPVSIKKAGKSFLDELREALK